MQINHLRLVNFRLFAEATFEFEPDFNLILGVNGAGKTALLEALAVTAGTWLLGIRGQDARHIHRDDIRLEEQRVGPGRSVFAEQVPVVVEASGEIMHTSLDWSRSLRSPAGRTTYVDARQVKELAEHADSSVRKGEAITLPVICYYGSGRLHQDVRHRQRIRGPRDTRRVSSLMRLSAYRFSVDARVDQAEFVRYFARESWDTFRTGETSPAFHAVRNAVLNCIEGARRIDFNPNTEELIVEIDGQGTIPFYYLSDGQRTMLAMLGDLCHKIVQLNPHLGEKALVETPGIVLIDELELHLHPGWQRKVVTDLQRMFPRIQFIATTHSPQVVGELPRRCVMLLNHDGTWSRPIIGTRGAQSREILRHVMGTTDQDAAAERLENEIDAAIDAENLPRAEELYNRFLQVTEEPTVQRQRVRALIENERTLQREAE